MIKIDKQKVYSSGNYEFRNFVTLDEPTLLQILEWRNHPSVRKWMYNQNEISHEDHLRFVESLKDRDDCFYWLVSEKGEYRGVVNMVSVNYENDSAENGFYTIPNKPCIGFFIYKEILNFVMNVLKIGHMYGATMVENIDALYLAEFFGCKYTSKKTETINGKVYEFYEGLDFTPDDFNKHRGQTMRDYLKFIKNKRTQ